jgi:hypothetical protein
MSNFKLEFTLQQHTPMIHFQSDQAGATLRATELKPKLDRFLIEYAFGDDFEKYKSFLIGYESIKKIKKREPKKSDFDDKLAFDYKVKIQQDLSQENQQNRALYFGNMGDTKYKYSKQHSRFFTLDIFTFHATLKPFIEEKFEEFLANTNFGTRQSKGYGSFYLVHNKTKIPLLFNADLISSKKNYFFNSSTSRYENDIKLFYAFLRAGINFPCIDRNREYQCPDGKEDENGNKNTRVYIKSAIFFYAKHLDITWDKKAIKEVYYSYKLKNQQKKYKEVDNAVNFKGKNPKLLRDIFGLSSEQDWGRDKITKENSTIERFKSPITFKPIKEKNDVVKVYFWVNNSVSLMQNKKFLIKKNGKGTLDLETPLTFDFDDFFTYIFDKSIDTFSKKKYNTQPEYKRLDTILTELKDQT